MKMLLWAGLLGGAMLVAPACRNNGGMVNITFQVEAPGLKPGAVVHVAGNLHELGDWHADGLPMMLTSEGVWQVRVPLVAGTKVEYKFTLGSWDEEAVDDQGQRLPNFVMEADRTRTVRHVVHHWLEAPSVEAQGGITGSVVYHRQVEGEGIAPRDIIVWLPPGYEDSDERYPVLYLHDGQNCFDPSTSYTAIDWGIDETADRLIREGHLRPFIAVGMYNTADRTLEYGSGELGKAYRRFVVSTVKPMIDAGYRTRTGPDDTATMGSSMGGLVAFLLAWDYPEVFRHAASLSPAFFPDVVAMVRGEGRLPDHMRLYMDNGTEGMDARIQIFCDAMNDALEALGGVPGPDFAWFLDQGADHHEAAWAARVHRPLMFLFGLEQP